MYSYYSDEKNVQILIALLKANGIKKVIASPGTTNISFIKSLQNDSFFEMFSSVDERSAAYMACGLAEESREPVVLSCTGATASRNYFPGLTEAYYRKLPILAVTSTQVSSKVGHHVPQVIDRSAIPNDVVKASFLLQVVKDDDDFKDCEIKANKAVLELSHHGGGPVHINLETTYKHTFDTKELPKVKIIKRITEDGGYPELNNKKVAVLVGSHSKMNKSLTYALEKFCESNNAVAFVDHTSGYNGKYAVQHSLISSQRFANYKETIPELTIHIGEISGDYSMYNAIGEEVWRVNKDGVIRDTFGKLTTVFEMCETSFFNHYSKEEIFSDNYLEVCKSKVDEVYSKVPELPFSNVWIAKKMHKLIPENSTIHFGILNSLRSWNFFELPESVDSNSNVGGFGIDGNISTLIGASLASKDKLYFGIVGDLAFFYDMNSLGNRHVGNNLRILLVNNGVGTEFKNFNHSAYKFGEEADDFIAARGHYGKQSRQLVKNYSENLGFEYLSASNKEEFEQVYERFLYDGLSDNPILFEVFTNDKDESDAIEMIMSTDVTNKGKAKESIKKLVGKENVTRIKNAVGQKNVDRIKKLIK